HVLCLAFTLGFESSAEAVRDWSITIARFGKPSQRRDKRGQIMEPTIPENVRYGLNNRPARKSKRAKKATGLQDGNGAANLGEESGATEAQEGEATEAQEGEATEAQEGEATEAQEGEATEAQEGEATEAQEGEATEAQEEIGSALAGAQAGQSSEIASARPYSEIAWPELLPTDDTGPFCGCGRGNNPSTGMIRCSRRTCPHN
ncbi:conserved hypothetical protein, partial [Perkinsus marinus ATCC 50983]